jgi:hypothetical protein
MDGIIIIRVRVWRMEEKLEKISEAGKLDSSLE